MADVGALANVSAQTVSRYFTGRGYVSDATRHKIEAAIEQLGYQFNAVASNLRVRRTDTVGVLTIGPSNYGNASLTTGVSSAARAANFSVLTAHIETSDDDDAAHAEARRAADRFLAMRVDGIIISTPFQKSEDLIVRLRDHVPVEVLAEETTFTEQAAPSSYHAGRLAMDHLAGLGHSEILHVAGPSGRNESAVRRQAYIDATRTAGNELRIAEGASEWTAASGFDVGQRAESGFTAVFAADDELALGFAAAMRERGLRTPVDYSIVGIDDIPEAAFFDPSLTTVRLDFVDAGRAAFDTLRHHLDPDTPPPSQPREPVLVPRESSRPIGSEEVRSHRTFVSRTR